MNAVIQQINVTQESSKESSKGRPMPNMNNNNRQLPNLNVRANLIEEKTPFAKVKGSSS